MEEGLEIFPHSHLAIDYNRLYKEVCEQIKKDFHPHAVMTEIPNHVNSPWIHQELKRLLTEIVTTQNAALGPILYRVDLSEKMVRSTMHTTIASNKIDELTMMVLRREAQKVWLRHTLK